MLIAYNGQQAHVQTLHQMKQKGVHHVLLEACILYTPILHFLGQFGLNAGIMPATAAAHPV